MYTKVNSRDWSDDDPRGQYIVNVSFDEYVREQKVFPIPQRPGEPWPLSLWINQLEWATDHGGNVVCDCLRLEALDADISAYFGRPIKVSHRPSMRTGNYDYRAMYTPETMQIVADIFAKDIDYFGFDFEGSATRNTYARAIA